MKALILAAGYATRLYPLTKEYPKPLLVVGNRPIIDYITDKLSGLEQIDEIIVVTNAKFISLFEDWAKGVKNGKKITLVNDLSCDLTDRLGAIGDINFVIKKKNLKDDLLVIGGDNLFDGRLNDFLAFAFSHKPSPVIGAYDIEDKKQACKYGVIKINPEKRIIDFQEKPKVPKSTLIAMCLYYFPGEKLGLIEKYMDIKTGKHDATGFYIEWLRKEEDVYAFIFRGRWYDIGHREIYNEAKDRFSN
ncbi:MAG: nucleotidyltransferase family protein [Deltaproteobacteria bacterium]